jgi:hypothetical protein
MQPIFTSAPKRRTVLRHSEAARLRLVTSDENGPESPGDERLALNRDTGGHPAARASAGLETGWQGSRDEGRSSSAACARVYALDDSASTSTDRRP